LFVFSSPIQTTYFLTPHLEDVLCEHPLDNFFFKAHIVGHAGKNVRLGRINSIVGLDPAGPLFSVRNAAGRLDAGDANYVECIHTNGPTLILAGAGIGAPIGHADFFPNGGTSQPGCLTNTCSHLRAVSFYGDILNFKRFQFS
jgi:pancreatic triacylglycerol lipase